MGHNVCVHVWRVLGVIRVVNDVGSDLWLVRLERGDLVCIMKLCVRGGRCLWGYACNYTPSCARCHGAVHWGVSYSAVVDVAGAELLLFSYVYLRFSFIHSSECNAGY